MHPMDRVAQIGMRSRPWVGRVFPDGFGEPAALERMFGPIDPDEELRPIGVRWRTPMVDRDVTRTLGWFSTPYPELLPERSHRGVVELLEPQAGADRLVLIHGSWGDESFMGRRQLAHRLAELGIASLLYMAPYHGPRRVHDGHLPIRTVADVCTQAAVAAREARSLLDAERSRRAVGVAGFSMGAGHSVVTSMFVRFPVAVALVTAAPSPARTFTSGIMGSRLAPEFDDEARARLFTILDAPSAIRRPPLAHHASAVMVSPRGDGFVDPAEARVLNRHWSGSELWDVTGGHGSTWVFGKSVIADAIERAFDRTYGSGTDAGAARPIHRSA
jgi:hypothetical protein